jgi:hypothetical protein
MEPRAKRIGRVRVALDRPQSHAAALDLESEQQRRQVRAALQDVAVRFLASSSSALR